MKIAPSLLSCDFSKMGEEIERMDQAGADWMHLDVMDGHFVPNITFGAPIIKAVRKLSNRPFDVHLMISEPIRYIADFAASGADMITVHVEACSDVVATIEKIREYKLKVGITLNPDTPVSAIKPYLNRVDMVLIMSVNPGFGGQKFITSSVDKIKEVKRLRDELNLSYDIEVDGGINIDNLATVLEAGANVIVAGSAIFRGDAAENVKKFKSIMSVW